MGTHGKARERTIKDLSNHKPFKRPGFAMSAIEGASYSTGQLPFDYVKQYAALRDAGIIEYTVLSYATPIAWVTTSGTVVIPDVSYSMTTNHHQTLCRVYL